MTTWPGPGSGSGTSVHRRTSGSPGAVIVTAYTLTEISRLPLNPPPLTAVSGAITFTGRKCVEAHWCFRGGRRSRADHGRIARRCHHQGGALDQMGILPYLYRPGAQGPAARPPARRLQAT